MGGLAGQPLLSANRPGQILAAMFSQPRLVIEKVQLRGAAGLKQKDDSLGFWCEVRQAGETGVAVFGPSR